VGLRLREDATAIDPSSLRLPVIDVDASIFAQPQTHGVHFRQDVASALALR